MRDLIKTLSRDELGWLNEELRQHLEEKHNEWFTLLLKCESPIEVRMYLKLLRSKWIASIEPQKQIGDYRVDFLIFEEQTGNGFVIECDGHDYHDRTKEQAARDKKRDRYIQSRGYQVYRFTGKEIMDNPGQCVEEIFQLVIADSRQRK